MEEQKIVEVKDLDWLKKEVENLKNTAFDEDKLPALKLEENKITEIEVDFSKEFDFWKDSESNVVKKIIPVTSKGEKFVWWLNVRNPVYGQLVQKGLAGQTKFKVLQTGSKQNTKYTLVE